MPALQPDCSTSLIYLLLNPDARKDWATAPRKQCLVSFLQCYIIGDIDIVEVYCLAIYPPKISLVSHSGYGMFRI